jgi:hypothetical protein
MMVFFPFSRVVCAMTGGTDNLSIEVCNRLACVAEVLLWRGAADYFEFC